LKNTMLLSNIIKRLIYRTVKVVSLNNTRILIFITYNKKILALLQ